MMRKLLVAALFIIGITPLFAAGPPAIPPLAPTPNYSPFLPKTIAFVGDSITDRNLPSVLTSQPITSTTAGDTSIIITSSSSTFGIQPGDTIRLCSNSGCTATNEQVIVANSYTGPLTTTVPINGTVANSGETFASVYSTRAPQFTTSAWAQWALARLGRPLSISGIFGYPNATSAQIIGMSAYTDQMGTTTTQDHVAQAINTGAQYIHIQMGANDVAGASSPALTAAQTQANIQTAVNEILAAGRIPIVGTLLPRGDAISTNSCTNSNVSVGGRSSIAQDNQYIRRMGYSGNIIIVDYFRSVADPVSGTWISVAATYGTGPASPGYGIAANVSYSLDCIHPNMYGAFAMSTALVNALQNTGIGLAKTIGAGGVNDFTSDVVSLPGTRLLVGSDDGTKNFDLMYSATFGTNVSGNVISNGGMMVSSACSSTLADNWVSTVTRTPSSGSVVRAVLNKDGAANNAYDRGCWQQVSLNQVTGTDWGQQILNRRDVVSANAQTLNASTWQPGDTVYAQATVKLSAASCGGSSATTYQTWPALQIYLKNGSGTIIDQSSAFTPATPGSPVDPSQCPMSLVLLTPPIVVIPNTARLDAVIEVQGSGIFQVSDVEIRKVITP